MMFRRSNWSFFLPLSVVLISVLTGSAAPPEDKPQRKPIEYYTSEGTNLNQLSPKKDGLRQLEEDLSKPFSIFSPKSSLDGIAAPPVQAPRAVVPAKRLKDLLDRKKNLFISPEDFTGGTAEEMYKLPEYDENGLEKKNVSALERYYDRLDKKRPDYGLGDSSDRLFGRKKDKGLNDGVSEEESKLLRGINASEEELKKMVAPEEKNSLAPMFKPVITDLFGLGSQTSPREEREIHNQRMNDYGNLIGLDSFGSPQSPLNSLTPVRAGWGDLYAPVRPAAVALPPGAKPVSISPAVSLPSTPAPAPALQIPLPTVREAPRAIPSVLDFPKRKF